jgi:MFS family permease
MLSDRVGRRTLIISWVICAIVYFGFASAACVLIGWFLIYSTYTAA